MKKVGVLMGSDSDLPVIRKATDTLRALGIPFEAHVYSAHRTPDEAMAFARSAKDNGFGVIIAAAGMAAAGGMTGAAMALAAVLVFLRYRAVAQKQFGGISGDLAGWFLQKAESISRLA